MRNVYYNKLPLFRCISCHNYICLTIGKKTNLVEYVYNSLFSFLHQLCQVNRNNKLSKNNRHYMKWQSIQLYIYTNTKSTVCDVGRRRIEKYFLPTNILLFQTSDTRGICKKLIYFFNKGNRNPYHTNPIHEEIM